MNKKQQKSRDNKNNTDGGKKLKWGRAICPVVRPYYIWITVAEERRLMYLSITEEKRKEKRIVLIPFLRHGDSQKEECVFWKVYAWLGLSVKVGTLFFHQVGQIWVW